MEKDNILKYEESLRLINVANNCMTLRRLKEVNKCLFLNFFSFDEGFLNWISVPCHQRLPIKILRLLRNFNKSMSFKEPSRLVTDCQRKTDFHQSCK